MKELFWTTMGLTIGFFAVILLADHPTKAPPPIAAAPVKCEIPAPVVAVSSTSPAPEKKDKETVIASGNNSGVMKSDAMPRPKEDLGAQLAKLSLAELKTVCGTVEKNMIAHNVDEYAKAPEDENERLRWLNLLFNQLSDAVHKKGSWWHGSVTITGQAGNTARLDFYFKLYGAHEHEIRDPFTSNMPARLDNASDICYGLRSYVTWEGRTSEIPFQTACQNPGRRRGDAFYIKVVLADKDVPAAATVLVPFPANPLPAIEYLSADSKAWVAVKDFVWDQSGVEEWQKLRDFYLKSAEGK